MCILYCMLGSSSIVCVCLARGSVSEFRLIRAREEERRFTRCSWPIWSMFHRHEHICALCVCVCSVRIRSVSADGNWRTSNTYWTEDAYSSGAGLYSDYVTFVFTETFHLPNGGLRLRRRTKAKINICMMLSALLLSADNHILYA